MSGGRSAGPAGRIERAEQLARGVPDPELPMLTLGDLGVLRGVVVEADGAVEVTLTPTYTGCPALATMRDDLCRALGEAGFAPVRIRVSLDPPWSTDDISASGRAALRAHGVSPPGPATPHTGPVPLRLGPTTRVVSCPQCRSEETESTSDFGATPCLALYRCRSCGEPFEHVKEH